MTVTTSLSDEGAVVGAQDVADAGAAARHDLLRPRGGRGLRPARGHREGGLLRLAPACSMGAVSVDVVIATFFNFNPELVRSAIPGAWDLATPEHLVEARFAAVDAAFRRILGDAVVGSPDMARAAELAQIRGRRKRAGTSRAALLAAAVRGPRYRPPSHRPARGTAQVPILREHRRNPTSPSWGRARALPGDRGARHPRGPPGTRPPARRWATWAWPDEGVWEAAVRGPARPWAGSSRTHQCPSVGSKQCRRSRPASELRVSRGAQPSHRKLCFRCLCPS